jgi:hypothetical protein
MFVTEEWNQKDELAAMEKRHKVAAERRKAVIVRSIVGSNAAQPSAQASAQDASPTSASGSWFCCFSYCSLKSCL